MTNEFNIMASMARFDAVDADCITISRVARLASVEVMHWEWSVARNFVQALAVADGLFHCVLVVENLVVLVEQKRMVRYRNGT